MSKKHLYPKKILWAFDPFEGVGETHIPVGKFLSDFTSQMKASVQPAYVLSPADFNVPLPFSNPWFKEYLPFAEKAMASSLKDVPIDNLARPKVILHRRLSQKQAVKALIAYAESMRADFIVTGTHSRHGLPRLFMGSFTETLLLQSKIPVLSVNPSGESKRIDHILFPTDLNSHSRKVYGKVVALAKSLGAKITLLHVAPHPIEPVIQSGVYLLGGGWVSVSDFMQQRENQSNRAAQSWITQARKSGVSAELFLDPGRSGVREAVLAQAKLLKVGMIAMAAESGPVSSALIGSVTRQIVREATCPVWVLKQ